MKVELKDGKVLVDGIEVNVESLIIENKELKEVKNNGRVKRIDELLLWWKGKGFDKFVDLKEWCKVVNIESKNLSSILSNRDKGNNKYFFNVIKNSKGWYMIEDVEEMKEKYVILREEGWKSKKVK